MWSALDSGQIHPPGSAGSGGTSLEDCFEVVVGTVAAASWVEAEQQGRVDQEEVLVYSIEFTTADFRSQRQTIGCTSSRSPLWILEYRHGTNPSARYEVAGCQHAACSWPCNRVWHLSAPLSAIVFPV